MGLFSEKFEKEEREFLKQIGDKLPLEDVAKIRVKYEHNFNSDRKYFEEYKKEVLRKLKPEHYASGFFT